jgi:phosphatidylserine/phosphatidylglycerophosphate/cardiolipin synthase-like enzyme
LRRHRHHRRPLGPARASRQGSRPPAPDHPAATTPGTTPPWRWTARPRSRWAISPDCAGRRRRRSAADSIGGGGDAWPDELEPHFRDVDIAIARTRGRHGGWSEVREIEALFADLVASARRHVYIETQYFASRIVAEAVGKRLGEPDGPEFVVVNPKTGAGWLDESVMGPARAELVKALDRRDRYGRFRIYTPVTKGGEDIYVHAKIMIVDDDVLRGSVRPISTTARWGSTASAT